MPSSSRGLHLLKLKSTSYPKPLWVETKHEYPACTKTFLREKCNTGVSGPISTSWMIYRAIEMCSICLLLRAGNMWLTEISERVSNTPSFASESLEFYLSWIHKGFNVTVDLWASNTKLHFLKFSPCSSFPPEACYLSLRASSLAFCHCFNFSQCFPGFSHPFLCVLP